MLSTSSIILNVNLSFHRYNTPPIVPLLDNQTSISAAIVAVNFE